jgi:hypothetical protein
MTPGKRDFCAFSGVFFLIFAALGVYCLLTGKFQLCVFRIFTGFPCPGCGLTRSFLALLQGDMAKSFQYHPFLLPVLFTFLTALSAFLSGKKIIKKNIFTSFFQFFHTGKYFYLTVFILLFLLFIARMILFFPDDTRVMYYEKHSLFYMIYSFFL